MFWPAGPLAFSTSPRQAPVSLSRWSDVQDDLGESCCMKVGAIDVLHVADVGTALVIGLEAGLCVRWQQVMHVMHSVATQGAIDFSVPVWWTLGMAAPIPRGVPEWARRVVVSPMSTRRRRLKFVVYRAAAHR